MIELKSVHLKYPLRSHSSFSFQSLLNQKVGGLLKQNSDSSKSSITYVHALKDLSFNVPNGCRLGIIGHNGAGKTSLLRLISGVYSPSSGELTTKGKISALTDFTLGMDPNMSGLKNIEFRLVFMGYSFREAKKATDEIIDFSGLNEFIHLPARTYSTGMFLRLAFAISTHFIPDILILDEVIGAGDENFKVKAKERLDKLISQARIVVLSSHDLHSISNYCEKSLWLQQGEIIQEGPTKEVIEHYLESVSQTEEKPQHM